MEKKAEGKDASAILGVTILVLEEKNWEGLLARNESHTMSPACIAQIGEGARVRNEVNAVV